MSASKPGRSTTEEAESAAAKIRAEAEAEAARYLAEYKGRIDEMVEEASQASEALIARANHLKQQYERLLSSVDSAGGGDTGDGFPSSQSDPASEPAPEPPSDPSPTRGGFRPRFATTDMPPPGTVVAQMADAGADREAVSKRLREEYGIHDPSVLLEQFGL